MHDDLNTLSPGSLATLLAGTGLPRRLLELARDEDLGPAGRDLTGDALPPDDAPVRADLVFREPGVAAGLCWIPMLLDVFGSRAEFRANAHDGGALHAGDIAGTLVGPRRDLVRVERTMLNLIARLSGVATLTARFVEEARAGRPHAPPMVLDTRKTTPGLRVLEKHAVRCGGGSCHRLGLHDAIMLKDNHLAGRSPEQIRSLVRDVSRHARSIVHSGGLVRFVEVEVDTIAQLDALMTLEAGEIDIALLDNMTIDSLTRCVEMRDALAPWLLLEASGGVRLDTIRAIARTGVDRISAGALTHQAASLDVALDVHA